MKRSALLLACFALGILTIDAIAQERPDFTGTWRVLPTRAAAGDAGTAGSLGSGWGTSFTLHQDADMLTLERVFFARADLQPAMKFHFALDGSKTRNTVLMGRGKQVQVATSAWNGDKLKITTVYHISDAGDGRKSTCEVTQTLSLQPPPFGRSAWPPALIVETMRSGVLGGPSSATRTVYYRN